MNQYEAPQARFLFNPAFCGMLLYEAVREHYAKHEIGISYPKTFLVLPMVLYDPVRQTLPDSVATKLHPWVQQHPQLLVNFPRIATALVGVTRAAILFAHERGVLSFDGYRNIIPGDLTMAKFDSTTTDTAEVLAAAKFVGRWLGHTGNDETTYAAWGIMP